MEKKEIGRNFKLGFRKKLSGSFRPGFIVQVSRALAICFFFVYVNILGSLAQVKMSDFGNWITVLIFMALSYGVYIVFQAMGRMNEYRDIAKGDEDRTTFAKEVLNQARLGNRVQFSLYLRPFSSTGKMIFDDPNALTLPIVEDPQLNDVERIVAESVEELAPLVALGAPGEHMGAGRILTSDDEWQEALKVLAETSQFIIMLPAENVGTVWEIGFLKQESLFYKTLFLMPPKSKSQFDVYNFWGRASEKIVTHHNLKLPPYDSLGGLFTIDNDNNFRKIGNLKNMRSFSKRFREAIVLLGLHKANYKDEFMSIKTLQKKTWSLSYRQSFLFMTFVSLVLGTFFLILFENYWRKEISWVSSPISTAEDSAHISHPSDWKVNRITNEAIQLEQGNMNRACMTTFSPVESFPFLDILYYWPTLSKILSDPEGFEKGMIGLDIMMVLWQAGILNQKTGKITDVMPNFSMKSVLRSKHSGDGRSGYLVELDVAGTMRNGNAINSKYLSALTVSSARALYIKCFDNDGGNDSVDIFLVIVESAKMN